MVIPYWRRRANLERALASLQRQTLGVKHFEVVIGAGEFDPNDLAVFRTYEGILDLAVVVSNRGFSIPRMRNLGMRQARGDYVVQMDADSFLAPECLEVLSTHFKGRSDSCLVGQVVGYGNNDGEDLDPSMVGDYDTLLDLLDRLSAPGASADLRLQVNHTIAWSFAWTGLIGLPTSWVRRHDLYFDEGFVGWGVDDLEWGHRVAAAGLPIEMREDVRALHLPHKRDRAANARHEAQNFRRFLAKWPSIEVELVHAVGDLQANTDHADLLAALADAAPGLDWCVVRTCEAGHSTLQVGVTAEPGSRAWLPGYGSGDVTVLPLIGIALPFADGSIDECILHRPIRQLPDVWRHRVLAEADRVAVRVIDGARDVN